MDPDNVSDWLYHNKRYHQAVCLFLIFLYRFYDVARQSEPSQCQPDVSRRYVVAHATRLKQQDRPGSPAFKAACAPYPALREVAMPSLVCRKPRLGRVPTSGTSNEFRSLPSASVKGVTYVRVSCSLYGSSSSWQPCDLFRGWLSCLGHHWLGSAQLRDALLFRPSR